MSRLALTLSAPTPPAASAQPAQRPVLLVHGILGQEVFYWHFMRRRLRDAGFEVHEITLPNLALGDLRAAATVFQERLDAWWDGRDEGEVDVVAHSAGGLVLRWYLKFLADDPRIRRVVTLGTPHGGTRVTSLLPEVGMMGQVRPGSAFMQALNDDDPAPGPTRYTAFWTPFDGVVLPAESARLPLQANVENVLYPGITHWGYLFGPRMARVLADELRRGFQGGERRIERTSPIDTENPTPAT